MLYGLLFTFLLSILAFFLSKLSFIEALHLSPLILAIFLGLLFSKLYFNKNELFVSGVTFSAKKILRLGIILYAFNISLSEILSLGFSGILASLIMISFVLILGFYIGVRFFKLDKELSILICIGSAICGAAAVLALESALKSKAYKGVIALSTVVLFGLLSMLLYPILYNSILDFKPLEMGFFIGLSLHEVANVVGAGAAISEEAANSALIVKMIRVILLVPALLIISFLFSKNSKDKALHIPYFALIFLALIIVNSLFALNENLIFVCKFLSLIFLSMAMAALGLQINIKSLAKQGLNSFAFAFVLFLLLGGLGYILTILFVA